MEHVKELPGSPKPIAKKRLINPHEVVFNTLSSSLKSKYNQALNIISTASNLQGRKDPADVNPDSSRFVITCLYDYTGMEHALHAETIKKEDALSGIITGMRWVYVHNGHIGPWRVVIDAEGNASCSGNPLIENPEVEQLRLAHRRKVAELGALTRSAPPLTVEYIVEHARRFWLVDSEFDRRDVSMHAIFLTALNCGLRYSEIEKIRVNQVSVTRHGISFAIAEKTKNSLSYNEYSITAWPGGHFDGVLIMDPFFALSAWLEVCGDAEGFLFCQIDGDGAKQRMRHHDHWTNKDFVNWMRNRFVAVGMASERAKLYTGHSLKRGSVQLLRTLGLSDVEIMKRIKMDGVKAYLRYTEAFNLAAPPKPPDFNNVEDMEAHIRSLCRFRGLVSDDDSFDFIDDWITSEY